jgi:hypothetical protein
MDIQLHVTRLMTSCLFQFDHVGANPYSLAEVTIATDNFKIQIGKGGFGPVYYGKLEDGQEVAIKVLDVKSSQGPSEFFNEVSKISRHFNDVVVFNLVVRKIITTHLPILKLQINQVTLLSRC